MKTKQLLSAAILSAALFFNALSVSAQVKIGTNPTVINTANNLEVESIDPAKKVSIDKTTGKITIADGTQGASKILTSDVNGVATWEAPAAQDAPVFLSVYKGAGADQPLGAGGTFTKANFTVKSFDKNSNFDLANDSFTVPANGAGYYQISGNYSCSPVTGQTFGIGLYMYVNGAIQRAVVSGGQNATGSFTVKLNAGDVLTFYYQTSFANATVVGSSLDAFIISR